MWLAFLSNCYQPPLFPITPHVYQLHCYWFIIQPDTFNFYFICWKCFHHTSDIPPNGCVEKTTWGRQNLLATFQRFFQISQLRIAIFWFCAVPRLTQTQLSNIWVGEVAMSEGVGPSRVVNVPVWQSPEGSTQQVEGWRSQGWAASCSSDGCLIVPRWAEILSPRVGPFHLRAAN